VELSGLLTVHLDPETEVLTVRAARPVHERLRAEVANHRLRVSLEGCLSGDGAVEVHVPAGSVHEVRGSGAIRIDSAGPLITDRLSVRLEGATIAEIELSTTKLETDLTGTGRLRLRGEAREHVAFVQGTGTLEAIELQTRNTDVEVVGTGNAEVLVTHKLKARVIGTGAVRYRGEPELATGVVGPGEVAPL
jgi:hypothetical protein